MDTDMKNTEVLIIGAGPVGLFAAALLGRQGVATFVVEKYPTRRGQPKAHALNPRTLEIFRQCGFNVGNLREVGADPSGVDKVRFVDSFTGYEYGSLPYERQFDDVLDLTPEPLLNVAQPLVEDYLTQKVQTEEGICIQTSCIWLQAKEEEYGNILSTILDKTTNSQFIIRSRYLIACDGARASSREALGISFSPLCAASFETTHYVTVHFEADLSNYWTGILFFLMQPHGLSTFICYDRKTSWVFVFRYDPDKISPSSFTDDYCRERVQSALGKDDISFKILSKTIWSTSPRIAARYRSSHLRNAFLAGDAAHTFSPTGGLGVNTGFADVHNLIWKIMAVRAGIAPSKLLDTYELERRPVAVANASQSTINEENIGHLGRLIAKEKQSNQTIPQNGEITNKGLIKTAIQSNADHFNSLDLQLGSVYGEGDRLAGKSVSHFEQQCIPGSRFPHCWIQFHGKRMSSLDLIQNNVWTAVCSDGNLAESIKMSRRRLIQGLVRVLTLGVDFSTSDERWISLTFPDRRAVVVRPDQHVAGHFASEQDLHNILLETLQGNCQGK